MLAKFSFGSTNQPAVMEASVTSADLSQKELGTSGAIVLAAFLNKCM
jgi:hypothetical protein